MAVGLRNLTLVVFVLAFGGCCGTQLCSTRFEQPMSDLAQAQPNLPYSEPPCGFQTVGGPPNMIPSEPQPQRPTANAPWPKFLPVPTRPVFGVVDPPVHTTPVRPAGPPEDAMGDRIWPHNQRFPDANPLDYGPADPPAPIETDPMPAEESMPGEMAPGGGMPKELPPSVPMVPRPQAEPLPGPEALPAPDDDSVAFRRAPTRYGYQRSRLRLVE